MLSVRPVLARLAAISSGYALTEVKDYREIGR